MKKLFLVFALILILVSMACSGSSSFSESNDNDSKSATIDASGGEVETPSGDAKVEIPSGAVDNNTPITIAISSKTTPSGNLTKSYEYGPEGKTFSKPVTISIQYDPDKIPDSLNQADLKLARLSGSNVWEVISDSTVDMTNHIVSGQTNHFSTYSVVANTTGETTYTISGTVGGVWQAGVTITLGGAGAASTLTDSSGNYSFAGLVDGDYTIEPSLAGYTFSPLSTPVTVSGSNNTGIDFTAMASPTPTYAIYGTVSGAVQAGVTITLSSSTGSTTTLTDFTGFYTFTGLADGNYTVTSSLTGYRFSPTSQNVTISGINLGVSFTAILHPIESHIISGTVSGEVQSDVIITLTGTGSTSTRTDAVGNYSFIDATNGNYTITPSLAGCGFTPTSISVTVNNADVTKRNFNATANGVSTATNLIVRNYDSLNYESNPILIWDPVMGAKSYNIYCQVIKNGTQLYPYSFVVQKDFDGQLITNLTDLNPGSNVFAFVENNTVKRSYNCYLRGVNLDGIEMGLSNVVSFEDRVSPQVTSATASQSLAAGAVVTSLSMCFSEPMNNDSAINAEYWTLNAAAFSGAVPTIGNISYSTSTWCATATLSGTGGTLVTQAAQSPIALLRLETGIKDISGNNLIPYTVTFDVETP